MLIIASVIRVRVGEINGRQRGESSIRKLNESLILEHDVNRTRVNGRINITARVEANPKYNNKTK